MNYLKLFAAGFGILFFMHLIVYNYKPYVMIESLVNGFFGGLAFMALGLVNYIAGKMAGVPEGETLRTIYEFEDVKNMGITQLKQAVKNAYSGRKIYISKDTENALIFRTPPSFKSIGTYVEYFFSQKDGKNSIKVRTRPIFKTIIIDYGASYGEMKYAKNILSGLN